MTEKAFFKVGRLHACGDWEWPVYCIIYALKEDPDKFYLYVPLKGNSYNPTTLTAVGSEMDSDIYDADDEDNDFEDYDEELEPDLEPDLILQDIKDAFNL